MISNLRQMLFPKEFRIVAPPWPGTTAAAVLRQWMAAAQSRLAETTRRETCADVNLEPLGTLLADLGTNVWRLQQKMLEPGTDRPLTEMRRVYRHVEAMWAALKQQGIEIQDPVGHVVPDGGVYGLKVLACQPTPGIAREKVLETVKPAIRYKEQVIQMGEVILAVPEKPAAAANS